jgi:hypothetical protein
MKKVYIYILLEDTIVLYLRKFFCKSILFSNTESSLQTTGARLEGKKMLSSRSIIKSGEVSDISSRNSEDQLFPKDGRM